MHGSNIKHTLCKISSVLSCTIYSSLRDFSIIIDKNNLLKNLLKTKSKQHIYI